MTRTLPALAAALTLTLAPPALAAEFSFDSMSEADRAAFGDAVRAYLLENPEVIMEAVAVLERREAAEQVARDAALIAANHDAIFNDPGDYVGGNPDGDIAFVEFVDYKCGYCRKAFPELKALIETDDNLRIIYKEFPILGADSLLASRFALSARATGGDEAYRAVHDAMMTMRGSTTEESLSALADGLGLDGAAILAGMTDPEIDKVIAANHALATRLQISGTPTFVIGEQLVRGYVPLEAISELIADLRETE
ncbi:MAG: disulfide bond formation protein DsbA [Rhodobacterales bacterium]|nr:MAG: disulfide bond formation protein DsbA [Rhodobacterales bacterium]